MNAPNTALHLMPAVNQRHVPQVFLDALRAAFGDRCSTAQVVCEQHGRDESAYTTVPPPAGRPARRMSAPGPSSRAALLV